MNKNDKLVVMFGVIIIIVASVGIFLYQTDTSSAEAAEITDVLNLSGELKETPDSIVVSDDSPFYPLIATPIAVHYNEDGEQFLIPLYVENLTDPSKSVDRLRCTQLDQDRKSVV